MKGASRTHKMLCRLIAGCACAGLLVPRAEPAAPAPLKRVGRITLEHCAHGPAYCGRIDRPLDPTGAIGGRISIYFEFYPHTGAGPSAGTLVATEGGPGYPATESREDYLALFRPLRATRDFVLMDNRGTGKSGAIDCPALQTAERWTVELVGAAIVMFGSAPALASVKEVDAAARAFQAGDRAPLLRLIAETLSGVDSRDPAADPSKWSAGLAAAVMCQDPPQIFDMRLAPAQRAADRDRALAERRRSFPDTYAPFTIDEYRGMPLDYSFLDQCLDWPVAPATHPAPPVAAGPYPAVPALVVSGEIDNMTTVAAGAAVARAFPRGRQVVIANGFHVNALPRARSPCGAALVRRFVETLEVGDARCAAMAPPVRLVGSFARQAAELEPAEALASNQGSDAELRLLSAAVLTAGDVVTRLHTNSSGHGVGLRGGRFTIIERKGAQVVELDAVRWTEDLAVSGTLERTLGRSGRVRGHLRLSGRLARAVEVVWSDDDAAEAVADIRGTLGGAHVAARMPAP